VQLPSLLINSLEGACGFDRESFLQKHQDQQPLTSIRLNPSKKAQFSFEMTPVPWSQFGFYLKERPSFTFDPLFHAGCYYVQEASSMLLEQAFQQLMDPQLPVRALDLCAAPGGKTTHLQSLLPPESLLVANEVIRSRVPILRDNCIRWGASNIVVTNNDPEHFRRLSGFFDWITVDAPCSGSGLFRKDPAAIEEWSTSSVKLCAERQQRILSAAWDVLKPGGILFYSTCSYSAEENEQIVQWMVQAHQAIVRPLEIDSSWGVTVSSEGYRCWPDQVKGEGFYCCCLQKPQPDLAPSARLRRLNFDILSSKEKEKLKPWAELDAQEVLMVEKTLFALSSHLLQDFSTIKENLYIVYAGVRLGEWKHDKFIPDHALAMSHLLATTVGRIELSMASAILFLQRKELVLTSPSKGWQVVCFEDHPLGWVNVLPGRVNNYYPKELRILKDS
jgi:16S rRNA C967 or C1407 C5-methylase (RsmB/RsmF family)/NOL1/NOP2/fmu family ribosome biogenesis protein